MFANTRIFSKLSQNVMDQGAIRNQQGMNPLYSDRTPSVLIALTKQSKLPEYSCPLPPASRGWFITRALTTSAGVPREAAASPAQRLDIPWVNQLSVLHPLDTSALLV